MGFEAKKAHHFGFASGPSRVSSRPLEHWNSKWKQPMLPPTLLLELRLVRLLILEPRNKMVELVEGLEGPQ